MPVPIALLVFIEAITVPQRQVFIESTGQVPQYHCAGQHHRHHSVIALQAPIALSAHESAQQHYSISQLSEGISLFISLSIDTQVTILEHVQYYRASSFI
jgi:hypothetical protein